ncbi:sigma-54-dependent Fis family transcriptional regulator [Caldimonas brevitalea]|uniref:Fis family transcriptional regulator n=1 Tax=Caldimonas brevitalea TaxID=413882 RepID=A0A0G3BNG6_9BURK|nr:sigma-54-dependent Fis family transcriptional regulator [Caldimonas brevitalea]AKJ28090.1 Fis family transcriptional regulator [Caldimonas brevitalea]
MSTPHSGSTPTLLSPSVPLAPSSATLPLASDPAHLDTIARSHARCTDLGLHRTQRPDFAGLGRAELALARERHHRLLVHAAPVMDLLLEQTLATRSIVALSDTQGTVLHAVGPADFLHRAARVALAPGANWSEASKGTNAVGTALIGETPCVVHGSEHFMQANGFLTCSAAPIFDPRGELLGVLDVSGDQRSYHPHTLGLVKLSVRMIENHWLLEDEGQALRLHFHPRAECLDTLMEGLVTVAPDGRLLAANRSALDLLGLSAVALRRGSLASVFGLSFGAVADHLRSALAEAGPMLLTLPDGRRLCAKARVNAALCWPAATLPQPATGEPTEGRIAPSANTPAVPRSPQDSSPSRGAALARLHAGDRHMATVVDKLLRVVDRDIPVLIQGETGTGKELLARAFHADSRRADHPFVALDCACLPETLIEAELFGHEEGAFTGARRKGAPGKIVQAHRGTLFLDEIGDMPLALQARLLRVLQERQVTPLGGTRAVPVDVAVVSATHRSLQQMVDAGSFRGDLYYRLNGLAVQLPPLRDREDLLPLAQALLAAECPDGTAAPGLDDEVQALLLHNRWPGNLRQLRNVLRTAAAMAAGQPLIRRMHLPDDFLEEALRHAGAAPRQEPQTPQGDTTLQALEYQAVQRALALAGGNISTAAKRLGISRNTLYRKLRRRPPPM